MSGNIIKRLKKAELFYSLFLECCRYWSSHDESVERDLSLMP